MSHSLEPQAAEHPPGIHIAKPTIMPLVWGAGFMCIAFGIIIGKSPLAPGAGLNGFALSALGVLIIVAATAGWLVGNVRERSQASETPVVAAKFAMWCFLGTEVIIFGVLIARVLAIWLLDHQAHSLLTEPTSSLLLVSLNTFLLLVSSLCVVLGLSSIQNGNRTGLVAWLAATALLGAGFVAIQGFEFNKLVGEGLVFGNTQFASAFYILTGNHGLHVIIGVIWCTTVIVRALRGGFTAEAHQGIEIFGLYWHFVDVVWILIFTLVYLI